MAIAALSLMKDSEDGFYSGLIFNAGDPDASFSRQGVNVATLLLQSKTESAHDLAVWIKQFQDSMTLAKVGQKYQELVEERAKDKKAFVKLQNDYWDKAYEDEQLKKAQDDAVAAAASVKEAQAAVTAANLKTDAVQKELDQTQAKLSAFLLAKSNAEKATAAAKPAPAKHWWNW